MTGHLAFIEFEPVAAIGEVVSAMIALTILLGIWLIASFGEKIFSGIPFVGGFISRAFAAAARFARGLLIGTIDMTLHAISKSWHATVRFFEDILNGLRELAKDLEKAIRKVLRHDIPKLRRHIERRITRIKRALEFLITRVLRTLRARINQVNRLLRHYIARVDRRLSRKLRQLGRTLRHDIRSLNRSLRARIRQVSRSLRHDVTATARRLRNFTLQRFAAAENMTQRLFQRAEHDIAVAKREAEHYAHVGDVRTYRQVVARVDQEAGQAARETWPEVTAMIGRLEKVAGHDFQDVVRMLRQLPADAPASLLGALAASLRFMPPVLRMASDCVLPDCRDLGPTRQALHDMQLPLTSAALIAWFVQMVTEPQQWADETDTLLTPLIAAEYGILSGLLGV